MTSQHTARSPAPAIPRPVLERKLKPGGDVREYSCTLIAQEPGLAVVEFRMPEGGQAFHAPIHIPPGSVSHGFFWLRRPYNLYRMRTPAGDLVAHRFDAVTGVRFDDDAISYRDLVLDWWVDRDDVIIEEDRDELEQLVAAGLVSPADAAKANEAAYQVLSRYRHVFDEAADIERRHRLIG